MMGLENVRVAYVYSREMALKDGVFVDVTAAGREFGFKSLVTLTCGVWDHYVEGKKDPDLALRFLLGNVATAVPALVRKAREGQAGALRTEIKLAGRTILIVLTMDEGGEPDTRVMFPEED